METKNKTERIFKKYKYFKLEADYLDRVIMSIGINYAMPAIVASEKITKLMRKKSKLVLFKSCVEKAIKDVEPKYAKILILKYVGCHKTVDIADILNIHQRSVFRVLEKAEDKFLTAFYDTTKELGYGEARNR